jgi:hypothetical protein
VSELDDIDKLDKVDELDRAEELSDVEAITLERGLGVDNVVDGTALQFPNPGWHLAPQYSFVLPL